MNKCLKLTMTVAMVALMCGSFAPQAQAYNEGDVALFRFNYIPELDDQTLSSVSGNYQNAGSVLTHIWPASVYNEAFGRTELPVAALNGTGAAREAATFLIPITVSDTGFPNMITWHKHNHYQNGPLNDVSFFRVSTDGTVKMWTSNGPHGTAPWGDYEGIASVITIPGCAATRGSASQITMIGSIINVGGCLVMGGGSTLQPGLAAGGGGGGGEVDLSGLEAGQAALEAKLDNLPAGPQGPAGADGTAGTAGTAGAAGADGAVGPAGADGTDAPCKSCADVANAAVDLACKIAADATSIAELQECADIVVNTLLISTNICEPECDVSSEITAAIDTKLNP